MILLLIILYNVLSNNIVIKLNLLYIEKKEKIRMDLIKNFLAINLDAPTAWGIYFQDSATPQMEGLVELHDNIMYYLVIILFSVG